MTWWRWRHPEAPITVDLRADLTAGRWTVVEMRVLGAKSGVGATHLRDVPLGELEADIAATWGEKTRSYPRRYPTTYTDVFDFALPPAGTRYPDGFFESVAEAYRWLTARGQRPGPVLAERKGVPITTVHGWIKQARKRGYLPPGRKGKSG